MAAYYTKGTPAIALTLARAENIDTELTTIVAAFDKIPEQLSLEQARQAFATDTGAADAYLVALPATLLAYTTGLQIVMKAVNANTGASTIDVDGLGVKSIKRFNGDALQSGDIPAGAMVTLNYDGVNFVTGGDAVTAAAASATAAATSETNAAASETAAAASETAAAVSAAVFFPAGTVMLFHQEFAPTSWTKDVATTLDNAALRIVTDTMWASGKAGATAFDSVFGSGKSSAGYALLAADVPNHGHADTFSVSSSGAHTHAVETHQSGGAVTAIPRTSDSDGATNSNLANKAVSDGAHTHPLAGAVTATSGGGGTHSHTLSLDLHYINMIIATKD